MRGIWILVFLLLGFIALGIIRYQHLAEQHASTQARAVMSPPSSRSVPDTPQLPYITHLSTTQTSDTALTPRNALAGLHDHYRLPPDRRFILALQHMQRLIAPDTKAEPQLEFRAEQWQVIQNGRKIAQFSKYPSFAEAKQLLFEVSEQLRPSLKDFAVPSSDTESPDSGFTLEAIIPRLRELNRLWSSDQKDANVLRQGVSALARLSWSGSELLEGQDTIMARTLALLVLAERATGKPLQREESMLAEAMGYNTHARRTAEQLNHDDPWRSFVLNEKENLSRLAQSDNVGADSIDLWLAQLALDNKSKEWMAWFERHYREQRAPVFALQTAHWLREFYPRTFAERLLPLAIALTTEKVSADNDNLILDTAKNLYLGRVVILAELINNLLSEPRTAPSRIMENINNAAEGYTGPFFDAEAYRHYYRGIYFSSLYRLGLHYLYSRNDLKQAAQFSRYLGSGDSPGLAELSTWYANLLKAHNNQLDMNALLSDLRTAQHIGIPTLERTLDELLPHYNFGSPQIDDAADFLASRLDSRISHRFTLAGLAREHLLYLSLAEEVYNSIEAEESLGSHSLHAWLGKYHNRPEQVVEVLTDDTVKPHIRAKAAKWLMDMEGTSASTAAILEQLTTKYPLEWEIHNIYSNYLEQQGDYEAALAIAQTWLEQEDENRSPFDYWRATITLSRQHLNMENTDAAWQAVSVITDSMSGGALFQATKVKIAQGELEQARQWAQRALERYPSSTEAIMNMVKVLWHQKKYREASQLLQKNKERFGNTDWRWLVGKDFAETFASMPDMATEAFTALLEVNLGDGRIMNIPQALADKKLYRLAFNTQKRIKLGGKGQLQIYVDAYSYLVKTEGREAALHWLEQRIPNEMRNFSSMIFFGQNEYSLLWDLIPQPSSGDHADAVWLYRAAAYAQGAPLTNKRQSQLMDYYHHHGQSKYDKMGRYILGLSDGSELLDKAMGERELSETAFYLGLAALKQKHMAEASDWFKISTRYSSPRNGEYRWSYDRLYRWKNAVQSLQVQYDKNTLVYLPD